MAEIPTMVIGTKGRATDTQTGATLRLTSTPRHLVLMAVVALACAILGSFAYDQYQRYDEALALADRDTRNAAILLAESTARTFDAIGESLGAAAALHGDVAAGRYTDPSIVHELLREIQAGVPVLRAIGWTDAEGNLVASSVYRDPPPLNVGDRQHFIVPRDTPRGGIYIGAPVKSRLTGEWIINVSLRLETPDGKFAGVAVGVIDPDYFASVYRSIELGPSRIAALYRRDGLILARDPPLDQRLGQSVATAEWFRDQVPNAPVGTFHGPNIFDGRERVVSYARIADGGEVVSVSVLRSGVLANFYRDLKHRGIRLAITLLGLCAGAWLLASELERRRRADRKFRALLEAAADSVAIVDQTGRIALVNAQAESLFGYGRAELLGRNVEVLMPQRYHDRHGAYIAQYLMNPRSRAMGKGLELMGRRKDGTEFPIEVSLSPLLSEEGLLVSAVIRDITQRKAEEAELIKARQAAELASAAKSDFLSSMSHELRTPLSAVIGFSQLLELDRERNLTEKQREYVRYIITSGNHLLDLVNQVLDLAGIEAGRLKLSPERVVVRTVFEEVRHTMLPLAQKAGIALEARAPEVLADIHADALRLRQILLNLVSNAIKYNRAGGAVSLSALSVPGERVRLLVADTGMGIAPERHAELFMPFQRLGAELSGVEGTGIGLALSRRLVEAMSGSIGFSSERGTGSTFWVELPAEKSPTVEAADGLQSSALASQGGYSLLYVEDNPANLHLMEHLLSALPDVGLLAAPTPQLGLDLAIAHRPDIIVLDINLPGMSGVDLLQRLKAAPETRDIPVLALSAAALPGDVRRGLAAGFFRYLTKPLDVSAFLAAVEEALHRGASPRVAPD
jgi:protein-histidine pros-kinase